MTNNNSPQEANESERSNIFEYKGEIITVMGRGFYWDGMLWPQLAMVKGVIDNKINKRNHQDDAK